MSPNSLLACFFCVSLACFIASAAAREAIICGDLVIGYQFSYQAAILIDGEAQCGGGIIDSQHILTAAHCISNAHAKFDNEPLAITVGTTVMHRLSHVRGGATVDVKKIYIPKEYVVKEYSTLGDIAVLKLKHRLDLAKHNLKRLQLPKSADKNYIGEAAIIAGFGWNWIDRDGNYNNGGNDGFRLRYARVDVLNECPKHRQYNPNKYAICGRVHQQNYSEPRGVCHGDSGSPLVIGDTVIGVLAGGPPDCSEFECAALYTRVTQYLKFIDDAVKDKKTSYMQIKEFH